jgi:hypothetical protein
MANTNSNLTFESKGIKAVTSGKRTMVDLAESDSGDDRYNKKSRGSDGAIVEALTNASERTKFTPRSHGGVSKSAMEILSKDPKGASSAGILITYHKLTASASPGAHTAIEELYEETDLEFWGLDSFRTQIQPIELIELTKTWGAVDVNKFASVDDKFGSDMAETEAARFFSVKMVYDNTLQADVTIIGNNVEALRRCMLGFSMALDSVYRFKESARVAIKAIVERYIKFVRNRHYYGPNSSTSGKMFQVIAKHFQQEINKIYMKVYGGAITTETAMVNAFNLIPELHQDSKLAIEFLAMRVQHNTVTPERGASPIQQEQARATSSNDTPEIETSAGEPKIESVERDE